MLSTRLTPGRKGASIEWQYGYKVRYMYGFKLYTGTEMVGWFSLLLYISTADHPEE